MSCHVLLLGHRLGLLAALAEQGPTTPAALAAACTCDERYVREWLAACTAGSYVTYDAATGTFALSLAPGRSASGSITAMICTFSGRALVFHQIYATSTPCAPGGMGGVKARPIS